ncbi:MAG: hypothetical protein F4Y49_07890 [Dehalococcoidia bacterium]|nr:hypothetical protein [Dehalococcoidia bacterium]MYA61006.1 hypothetical protein [Dehalococcoidia bacterium]
MSMQPRVELIEDEEIVFEDEQTIITNRRLIGNFGMSKDEEFNAYDLAEVGTPNKFNGGQYGKRTIALRLLIGGAAVVIAGAILQPILQPDDRIEALVFVLGAVGSMVGLYMLLNDLFRPKPNTTVIFPIFDGKDIISSYPDWDNPEAEELVRNFARIKRGTRR